MVKRVRLRLRARPPTSGPSPGRFRLIISGAMSPNAITHECPQAGTFFDQLQINRQEEGCDSLDELAWRRGMNVAELLEALQRLTLSDPTRRFGAGGSASSPNP